jgi:type VI secretion system protein ImpK
MQSAIAEPIAESGRRVKSSNALVNLAAPMLELALKMQSGAINPSNEVRNVVDDLLKQLEQGGVQLRCHPQQIYDLKFALVAFIDETVLSPKNNFPLRSEWERNPLQLVYFDQHLAGIKFFERLDAMMREGDAHADIVEVYYLCLLLGFKGKFNIHLLEQQLKDTIVQVAQYLRSVGRLTPNTLSAHWQATDQPEVPKEKGIPIWFKLGLAGMVAIVLLTWVVLYILLQRELTVVR